MSRHEEAAFEHLQCVEATMNPEISAGEMDATVAFYQWAREQDQGVKLGLVGEEEVRKAAKDAGTVMLRYCVEGDSNNIFAPLLVPTQDLEWYNTDYLTERYGADADLYCYVHPPIPDNISSKEVVAEAVKRVLDGGAVVLLDQYRGDSPFDEGWDPQKTANGNSRLFRGEDQYLLSNIADESLQKRSDIFEGIIPLSPEGKVQTALPIYDVYQEALRSGELVVDPQDGASLELVMSDDDAQRVWEVYEKPFEELSKGNPVLAGFDEQNLKDQLRNPDIIKMVHRKSGVITSVGVISEKFDIYPWFNEAYYKEKYPEYHATGNILLCPGIVSDETMRGHNYSLALVDLMAKVLIRRNTNILLAYECTEISTQYISSKVLEKGAKSVGLNAALDLGEPAAVIEYKTLEKSKA